MAGRISPETLVVSTIDTFQSKFVPEKEHRLSSLRYIEIYFYENWAE